MNTSATVTRFVLTEYLPDEGIDDLDPDYDLIATGVIDSLGLLQLTSWLQEEFAIPIEMLAVGAGDVRSVRAICEFIGAAAPAPASAEAA
jgi:acyl carrier protein